MSGPMIAYDTEIEYHKPLPSDLMRRAQKVGRGQVAANVKLVEARQRGGANPSASLLIDYSNTQGVQINHYIESKWRDGSVVYARAPGTTSATLGEVLWTVREKSSYTGDFLVHVYDKAGFLRYTVKNIRRIQAEELSVFVNKSMEVGSMGFCGLGASPPDITRRPPDFVVTHPSRDRYQVCEGPQAGHHVVAEVDRHGQASFTTRVAPGMDVALSMTLSWVIDRCRCRFDLASSRWRGHAGNVFYKGKMNWKRPQAVSLSRGGIKKPG